MPMSLYRLLKILFSAIFRLISTARQMQSKTASPAFVYRSRAEETHGIATFLLRSKLKPFRYRRATISMTAAGVGYIDILAIGRMA